MLIGERMNGRHRETKEENTHIYKNQLTNIEV